MTYTAGIDIGSGAVKTVLFKDDTWLAKAHQLARVFDGTLASSDDAEASTAVLTGTGDLVVGPPKAPHKQLFRWNPAAFGFQPVD